MTRIREATRTDTTVLAHLHEQSIRGLGPAAYDEGQVDAWASDIGPERYPIDDPDQAMVVAEVEGQIAGFGILDVANEEVAAVYVHPIYSGRGLGSTLLEHLEERALDVGIESLRLVASMNAVRFYERNGWVRTGECRYRTGPQEVELPCVEMKKPLVRTGTCARRRAGDT